MNPRPTRKDLAEFYRLALTCGLCTTAEVVVWSDLIVAADERPDPVFLDLSCSRRARVDAVLTLLRDVPGTRTGDLGASLLLGHARRMLAAGEVTPADLLTRLTALASEMPPDVESELMGLDDALYLARDGSFGTTQEVYDRLAEFLSSYEAFGSPFPG